MNSHFETYQRELNALHYTPEQINRIAAQAAETAPSRTTACRVHAPIRRTVILAAALALVLAVSVGATGILKSASEAFANVFAEAPAQTEIIDKIGRPIGASATDNGVTVTADAIIGDRYNACIVYTVSRDDGTALLPEDVTPDQLLGGGFGWTYTGGSSYGSSYFQETDDPSTIQYVESVSSDQPLNQTIAEANYDRLYYFDEQTGEEITIAEGNWHFRFEVDYEDSSISLGGGETFRKDGFNFTIDEVTLSPVALRVVYTADLEINWYEDVDGDGGPTDSDIQEMARCLENVEILITKIDGSVIDMSGSGGSVRPENGRNICTKGGTLGEIVPLDEIASISVGGVAYTVS